MHVDGAVELTLLVVLVGVRDGAARVTIPCGISEFGKGPHVAGGQPCSAAEKNAFQTFYC